MSAKANNSILITGGAGYIGSHVTKVLLQRGYSPVILDDLSTGHSWAVERLAVPFYRGCISDRDLVAKILDQHRVCAIMHFAAKAIVSESVQYPLDYFEKNIAKTIRLIDVAVDRRVQHVVFSSTCATYGTPRNIPICESDPQTPINPYGRSKLAIEGLLKDCFQAYGLSSSILRYFNAAGCDPEGLLGESHNPETHLIPLMLKSCLEQRESFRINGRDYETPDGTCIRDYVHVNDLAQGHILAMEYGFKNKHCDDFNLGTGTGFSNLEVLKMAEKVLGHSISHTFGPRRPGDPPALVADPSKAFRTLGWKPAFELRDMISTAWTWFKQQRSINLEKP